MVQYFKLKSGKISFLSMLGKKMKFLFRITETGANRFRVKLQPQLVGLNDP